MNESVEYCVSNSTFSHDIEPAGGWKLAGNDGGTLSVPIFDNFKQIKLLLLIHFRESKIVKDEQRDFGDLIHIFHDASVSSGHFGFLHKFLRVGIDHGVSVQASLVSKGGCQEAFTTSCGSGYEY